MQNYLIFVGETEDNSTGNEAPEVTQEKLRQHLKEAFNIAGDVVDSIKFERVYRSPGHRYQAKNGILLPNLLFTKIEKWCVKYGRN
ncbi:hypothetical protein DPMN_049366 [Dreissena polymorpha]|uniref:Uncharacterized protein n=1 Tax=Dreissena polymorpha TaxID=45954 RepID=A0A9D4CFS1_DREPO|nr:hypothetical protein DPMN_049366 [Dreissena polymorpha]